MKHCEAFLDFQKAFPAGMAEEINELISKWNADPDNSINPYEEAKLGKLCLGSLNNYTEF